MKKNGIEEGFKHDRKKEKVLIYCTKLDCGGVEKSLVSFLNQVNTEKYEVYLQLVYNQGVLIDELPPYVHLLPALLDTDVQLPIKNAVICLLKKRKVRQALYRVMLGVNGMLNNHIGEHVILSFVKPQKAVYDYEVVFDSLLLGRISTWLTARTKDFFVHFDPEYYFNSLSINEQQRVKRLFGVYDNLYCVSFSVREKMKQILGTEEQIKLRQYCNIIDVNTIKKMSCENLILDDKSSLLIVTVGRLSDEKGIYTAIEACKMLKESGEEIKWLWIGGGELDAVREKALTAGIADCFVAVGEKSNPYPYIRQCDIYVQPSKWESYGMSVAEALIIGKPVVVSDIPSFHEIVKENIDGIFFGHSAVDLAKTLSKLIRNRVLITRMVENTIGFGNRYYDLLERINDEIPYFK